MSSIQSTARKQDAFVNHDGCRLAYSVRGEGLPVLMIQGVGVHGNGWLPQVDGLRDSFQCLTFDNRGMGQSQPFVAPLTVKQMADDARALLDAQGWESAHVVGHSLGGLVALELAIAMHHRVRSLSMLCTFSRGKSAAPPTPRMIWIGARTRIGSRVAPARFLQLILSPLAFRHADVESLADRLEPLFGHDLADQPAIVGHQLKAMRGYDAMPRLAELAGIPALVVSATHDPIAPPRLGRTLAKRIPGAHFIEIPDASHGLPIQSADVVNTLLRKHFVKTDADARARINPART